MLGGLATDWTGVGSELPRLNAGLAEGLSTARGLGGIFCKLLANGTEKVVLKPGLKGVFLPSKATFVSARFTPALAQIGKTLQVLSVCVVLSDTKGVEETGTPFAGATGPLVVDVPLNVGDVVICLNAQLSRMTAILRVHHLSTS